MFSCPNCAQVLGDYPDRGTLVVACARCTFKYEANGGVAMAMHSQTVELTAASERARAVHIRRFELVVATSIRETVRFTFDTDRADDWVRIAKGDQCAIVFSMRGDDREELLFVVNRTAGERFVLAKPGQRSKKLAVLGGIVVSAVLTVAGVASALPLLAAGGLAVAIGVGANALLRRWLRPTNALAADERDTLSSRQALLGQKRELLRSREIVVVEIEGRRALRQRLESLRDRMVALRLDGYADRIVAIERALATLMEQLELDVRLADEYERAIQILDIEHESSLAAEAIPSDSASIVAERLLELRDIEELRADTTRRLAANAEVERLLRHHTT